MDFSLELVTVPVRDIDQAKGFYVDRLGFRVEHDQRVDSTHRHVLLAPSGSACRIALQSGYVNATPGSLQGTQLVVDDIDAARSQLIDHGVAVSEVETYPWGRFFYFTDPDGNGWSVQQPTDPS